MTGPTGVAAPALIGPLRDRRAIRSAFWDAWHNVTWREIAWALGVALAFVLANGYSLNGASGRGWPLPVRSYEWVSVPLALLFLVAFRTAEHPRLASVAAWRRYAVAILVAGLLYWLVFVAAVSASGEVHAMNNLVAGLAWSAVHVMTISSSSRWCTRASCARVARKPRSTQRHSGERGNPASSHWNHDSRRCRRSVEPSSCSTRWGTSGSLYDRNRVRRRRWLDDLIAFLRAAMPSGLD